MDELEAVDYVDEVLGSSVKSGYNCFYAGVFNTWLCFANPRDPGSTADRFFHFDQRGVIRSEVGALANSSSPPVD